MEVIIKSEAQKDLDEAYDYLDQHASSKIVTEFILTLEFVLELISSNPDIGNNSFINLSHEHKFKVYILRKFNYAIFYTHTDKQIYIARIIHTSRDINNILF